jgi:hypothetical protein
MAQLTKTVLVPLDDLEIYQYRHHHFLFNVLLEVGKHCGFKKISMYSP